MAYSSDDSDERPIIKRKRTNSISMEKRTATLMDLDVIDCPICYHALTVPILQCNNGHIVCSTCCEKLSKKCAICSLPIQCRNRAMERVLELLKIPCPNAESGCLENILFDKISSHLDQCAFTKLLCPFTSCNFIGLYEDFYEHCVVEHCETTYMFERGQQVLVTPLSDGERVILKEHNMEEGRGELVLLECFDMDQDHILYASCIGPGKEFISYSLELYSATYGRLIFESYLDRVHEVRDEPPEEHFMKVPSYMSREYKFHICINQKT